MSASPDHERGDAHCVRLTTRATKWLGDGFAVVGEVIEKADAPEPDAIQWILLRAKSHEASGTLSAVAYIRRTETKGGVAPGAGCDSSHLSEQARTRYSATYQFFSPGKT